MTLSSVVVVGAASRAAARLQLRATPSRPANSGRTPTIQQQSNESSPSRLTSRLNQDGLQVARLAVGALEALAQARAVVAQATAGAVTVFDVVHGREVQQARGLATGASLGVGSRRALLLRAVGTAEASLALAAHGLGRIPSGRVHNITGANLVDELGVVVVELLLGLARAVAAALVGAHGTVAGAALIAVEALALAGGAVAHTSVGALGFTVSHVLLGVRGGVQAKLGDVDPGNGVGAGALRAVSADPGGHLVAQLVNGAILADEAGALVVLGARTVATAGVGARGHGAQHHGGGHDKQKSRLHCAISLR